MIKYIMKYIIIIIIILIILYFKYKIEKFRESNINATTLLNILTNNNIEISNDQTIYINTSNNTLLPLNYDTNSNIISLGDTYNFNINNNETRCYNKNLDNTGYIKNNKIIKDLSGNLIFDEFIYDYNKKILENKKLNLKTDNKNISIKEFSYNSDTDKLVNNNSLEIDSNNNISFGDNKIDSNGNYTNIKSIVTVTNDGNIQCNNYNYDKQNNRSIYNNNNVDINISQKLLSNKDMTLVKTIKLAKYNTNGILLNNDSLHISSIKFFDYNNIPIPYNKYITTTKSIYAIWLTYQGTNKTSKIDSRILFENRNPTKLDAVGNKIKYNFIGHGQTDPNSPQKIERNPLLLGTPVYDLNGFSQEYIFTFYEPTKIKYVEIENRIDRKERLWLNPTYLMAFDKFDNKIYSKIIQEPLINNLSTSLQNTKVKGTVETTLNDINTYPANIPIIRHYIT
jgi:hypothetical protein